MSCAQIGYPAGGPKDTIPPVLLNAFPPERTTNFTGNKVTLVFNEYIEVQDIQNNLLVAPYPKTMPGVTYKLRTVTVKIKDTLLPNTTYSIDFGNSLRDLNESNPFRNYSYVFSTGNTIDSFTLAGNVTMAETGKADSTLTAILYKDANDSTVQKRKPDYIARLDKQGNYKFKNLSAGIYRLYALKDGDGGKTYNSAIEQFAFLQNDIVINSLEQKADTLYAYAEEKESKKTTTPTQGNKGTEKKLRMTAKADPNNKQDLLQPFEVTFNRAIKTFDEQKIKLTDSFFNKISGTKLSLDSTRKVFTLATAWKEGADYFLIVDNDAVEDTTGAQLTKSDTIRFRTKEKADYGNLLLRFTKLDTTKHPVLQFLRGDDVVRAIPVTANTWNDKLFEPGDYDVRIVYDTNNNGVWDAGSYTGKRQPEKAITLPKKISVRAGWDNEKDIEL